MIRINPRTLLILWNEDYVLGSSPTGNRKHACYGFTGGYAGFDRLWVGL